MTTEEAMQKLAKAWLEAPRTPLGNTSSGGSRGDLVKCPACGHLILMTRPGATEHLQHHRELASVAPFRFWLDLAPITGMLPVALLNKDPVRNVAAPPGTRASVIRAVDFIRKNRALLVRAGILVMKRGKPDFVLIAHGDWTALCGMTAQEDFSNVALEHYTQQAMLRPTMSRRPAALLH